MAWRIIKASGRGGRNSSIDYVLRIVSQGEKLVVTIPEKTMKRLKWKLGDRVQFLIDDQSHMFGVRRTTDLNALTLTHHGKRGSTKHSVCKCKLTQEDLAKCVNGSPRLFSMSDVLIDDDEDMISVELLPNGNS